MPDCRRRFLGLRWVLSDCGKNMMSENISISIVGPVYIGTHTVANFIKQTREVLTKRCEAFEIILVDDGCPAASWDLIENTCRKDPAIKGIRLSRNFGQQIAVSAGLHFAKGERVIVMDTDLQNPPEAIPVILEKLQAGADVVYTVSKVRNNWIDEITSSLFWFVVNKVLGVHMVPNQLMMKGLSRKFLSVYNTYNERVRVVAGIAHDIGMRSTTIEVGNARRESGRGNHGFFRRLNLMIDIVLAISSRPLNLLINISLLSVLGSLGLGAYTLIVYLIYPDVPPGYATLISIITFFGSMTLLVLGIIGRYLANIYTEVRQRPLFITESTANL
jgi:glycosyltransferase involved in cell wall biosynthesis